MVKNPNVGDKVAVLNNETGRYVLAAVTSVYSGPKQARVSIDGTDDIAILLWADLHDPKKAATS
jgi:predicted aspartyl protease